MILALLLQIEITLCMVMNTLLFIALLNSIQKNNSEVKPSQLGKALDIDGKFVLAPAAEKVLIQKVK
jgi:hypothetical protein